LIGPNLLPSLAAYAQCRDAALAESAIGAIGLEIESHLVDLDHVADPVLWKRVEAIAAVVGRVAPGTAVTVEPGGQIELSGPPEAGVGPAVMRSVASLAANVAVAERTEPARVIAAWPSFALIASYELLMRQVCHAAEAGTSWQRSSGVQSRPGAASSAGRLDVRRPDEKGSAGRGREAQVLAWQWALANSCSDGSLPSGRDIGRQHGRHERWDRLVKRSGLAGGLDSQT